MKRLILAIFVILFSAPLFAQLPDFTSPIPLDAGDRGGVEPNANNILFFQHPAVPNSNKNFQNNLTNVLYDNGRGELKMGDLLGAPGFPDTSPEHLERENRRALLADPAGLCYQSLLVALAEPAVCHPMMITGRNQLSWQQMIADLRNYLSTEPAGSRVLGLPAEVQNVVLAGNPDMAPYNKFGLGSLIGDFLPTQNRDSPPAICYDIVEGHDLIACPVFGRIYVGVSMDRETIVEFQSPILLYRKENDLYHLAGYLANPTPIDYELFGAEFPDQRHYMQEHLFPVAIAAISPFSSDKESLVVMNTATLPFSICHSFAKQAELEGLGRFPWGDHCTYGVFWNRANTEWSFPRETFDSTHTLLAAPKIYDLAVGRDVEKEVLFAPSNAPSNANDPERKFYVLKYFDDPSRVLDLRETRIAAWQKLITPKPFEVTPPEGNRNYGPFKIAVSDINQDGYSDFALTWKFVEDRLADTEHRIWKSSYSPYVSVHFSRKNEAGEIVYDQFDFRAPEERAEIAAIAFGEYQGQKYLVAGDNHRERMEDGKYHAFATLFPIVGGIVDNLNFKKVQVSFKEGRIDAPGVGDLTTDPSSGVVAAALRDPFLRAPESCDAGRGVYGYSWLWETRMGGRTLDLLDFDHDGIPNRCECLAQGFSPDEDNDRDLDELADVRGCDDCANNFNVDLETNVDGHLGDGVADACDNCPPSRCAATPFESLNCNNPRQGDRDGDHIGDSCDACPDSTGLENGGVYAYDTESDCFREGLCDFILCTYCSNGFIRPDGTTSALRLYGNGCDDSIVAPGTAEIYDLDGDGVPDARDNCVKVYNPPRTRPVGVGSSVPSGQDDSDHDGSGDHCDCSNAGRWDDCDGDGVPNRFDPTPRPGALLEKKFQFFDTVYDPQPHIIAVQKDLRPAQLFGNELQQGLSGVGDLDQLQNQIQVFGGGGLGVGAGGASNEMLCGFPAKTWPGPANDCDYMGRAGKEVTVILPKPPVVPEPPHPPRPPEPPLEPEAGISATQHCIARVGRKDPNSAAIFPELAQTIIEANNRAHAITGIPDFDIFVGADGGIIHWECALVGGAFGVADKATGILPDVSESVAPYMVVQLSGLPPVQYGRRPDPELLIQPSQAILLAPLSPAPPAPASSIGQATGGLLPPRASAPLDLPNLSLTLPGRRLGQLPSEGVQMGILRENINGNMVVRILTSQSNLSGEGAELPVNDVQSLFVLDYKTYPEPSIETPVDERVYNVESILAELTQKVADWKRRGKPITAEIYQGLAAWEPSMHAEFLVAQNTIPEAISEVNKSLSADAAPLPDGAISQAHLPAYIVPSTMTIGGGGCSCRLSNESLSAAGLLTILCILLPVPLWMYARRRFK